jgi:excisionase family DNA binding protein
MSSAIATEVKMISKEAAADRLGISTRRVLEFAQAGSLRSEKRRNPETNLWTVVFHAGDVERLRDERATPRPNLSRARNEIARANAATLAALATPATLLLAPAAPPRLWEPHEWLTLAEAAIYLRGLPEAYLLTLIDGKKLPACNVGVRPGGRWRVKRSDLDSIQAA